jgi:hypothetical protein
MCCDLFFLRTGDWGPHAVRRGVSPTLEKRLLALYYLERYVQRFDSTGLGFGLLGARISTISAS